MSEGWWLAIAAIVILLAMSFGASFIATFQRETSGIESRWLYRDQSQRAELVSAISTLGIDANLSGRGSLDPTIGDPDGDYDGDGIPNQDDPDPTNPDSDGDGTSDGAEVEAGTDPTDPNDGGIDRPPQAPPGPLPPITGGLLRFDYVVKQVSDMDETWSSAVTTLPGETVNFEIELRVTNPDAQTHSLTIEDRLSAGLSASSIIITLPGGQPTPANSSLKYVYPIPTGVHMFHLAFSAVVRGSGVLVNEVVAYQTDLPSNRLSDVVFIFSKHPDWGIIQPGGTAVISAFDKKVKDSLEPANNYRDSITTSLNRRLDFQITFNTQSFYLNTRTFILSDILPRELRYIPGSGSAIMDQLFNHGGYIGVAVAPGDSQFRLTFSATVIEESDSPISNWVQIYDQAFPSNRASDNTPIYFE